MKYPSDLTGLKFGRLTVLEKEGIRGKGKRGSKSLWRCHCDCGKEKIIVRNSLVTGNTKSCGCLRTENERISHLQHGMAKTRIWKIWIDMKSRCNNKSNKSYSYYGGRGISVCEEWMKDFMSFYNWSIENGYKDGLTIDRKDNNGNYCPENCRWATRKDQTRNRRITKKVIYKGEEKTIGEISEIEEISYQKAYDKYGRHVKNRNANTDGVQILTFG